MKTLLLFVTCLVMATAISAKPTVRDLNADSVKEVISYRQTQSGENEVYGEVTITRKGKTVFRSNYDLNYGMYKIGDYDSRFKGDEIVTVVRDMKPNPFEKTLASVFIYCWSAKEGIFKPYWYLTTDGAYDCTQMAGAIDELLRQKMGMLVRGERAECFIAAIINGDKRMAEGLTAYNGDQAQGDSLADMIKNLPDMKATMRQLKPPIDWFYEKQSEYESTTLRIPYGDNKYLTVVVNQYGVAKVFKEFEDLGH